MDKKQLITEVNDLLETYCEGCFLREHNRKTNSKYYAHSFCIRQCTVGETLKKYGEQYEKHPEKILWMFLVSCFV